MTSSSWNVTCQIGSSKPIPLLAFDVVGGCYGSVGHATMTTSLSALTGLGVDLYALTANAGGVVPVFVYAWAGTGPQPVNAPLFGGEYVSTHWNMDADTLEIRARDWAGVLVDTMRVLTTQATGIEAVLKPLALGKNPTASGISNENQLLTQIVTSVGQEFNLTPILNLQAGSNPVIGAAFGASTGQTFMPSPQSLWAILNQLARDTGNVVFVTPTKQLYFGLPGGLGSQLMFCFQQAAPPTGALPCKSLMISHHPRRNSTFRVLVISYDPGARQATLGQATVIGRNFAGTGGTAPGIYAGAAAGQTDAALASQQKGVSVSQVPLYTFHLDGLTASQATAKASAIASDIAKHEFKVGLLCDLIPGGISPSQKLQVSGRVPSFMSNVSLFISGYTHKFRIPRSPERNDSNGLVTDISCLNIPVEGLAGAEDG